MKNIHPTMTDTSFECASCGSKFQIKTTLKEDKHPIDVCSKCHPFYIGKVANKQLRGRSEKLSSKFEAGKMNMNTKNVKTQKVRKSRENKGFESL